MNAEQYLNVALDENMNIGMLRPLAWYEIMESYARHKLVEAQPQADNTGSPKLPKLVECCDWVESLTIGDECRHLTAHEAVIATYKFIERQLRAGA